MCLCKFLVPAKFQHPYPLCVADSLSYHSAPPPSYNDPKVFEVNPEIIILEKPQVSGAQVEEFLLAMSAFSSPLENGTT
jgi:hypothetical protein